MQDYQRDPKSGKVEPNNPDNVRFLLKGLGIELRFNAWTERIEIKGGHSLAPNLIWKDWTPLTDTIVAQLCTHARRTHTQFAIAKDFLWDCLISFAQANTVDPALALLDQLEDEWDGEARLDTWLIRACHTPDDAYHRAISRLIVGGIVLRARKPGCKFDSMPIFFGPQGSGKSTMARILALNDSWFTDAVMFGDASKELVLSLAGILVAEVSEMGSKSTANVQHIKAMVSRQVDRGRTAYARSVSERPRRNIWIGTTNDSAALSDTTGNRRFLPIAVNQEIDLAWLRENVGQLIGEAANLHTAGETFELPREVWAAATAAQNAVTEEPEWRTYFQEWFAASDLDVFVTAADLADFAKAAGYPRAVRKSDYLAMMTALGFAEHTKRVAGKGAKIYYRGNHEGATRLMPKRDNSGRMTAAVTIEAAPPPLPGLPQHLPAQV